LNLLSAAYGTGARLRRSWYERHPERVRRLERPVISVGNLTVGGSGKTPLVAALATLLKDSGEAPVVLSRGYARKDRREPVVVVSDFDGVRAPVEQSGDEPQMLARELPGVPIIVGADRFAAGRLAQSRFAPTVFVLDDGFQHLQLARDVDLVIVSGLDLEEQPLPTGRLREPLDAARRAHALIVFGGAGEAEHVSTALGVPSAFIALSQYRPFKAIDPEDDPIQIISGRRVLAVAGIARPERFFSVLRMKGHTIAREMRFRDHHWFTRGDIEQIMAAARDCNADLIVTTEKDVMRLPREIESPAPFAYLPMSVTIEPAFTAWLSTRLHRGAQAR